ncbi:Pimeloyl-ACP methyl ester carboxylesterase [Paramicrobacterium humi]|uniref:Pimeloyl-ACP methyl ester carboxylesterase n=1 Tax=Paramicrobacterium humi TaxID=640635 RepID=A0A1H4P9V5_9MICO|nr:alpha/beta hydrolase [Microbacterium humi]SEC03762.1 Pimeloyl-ACP methyl ester carboxylesterase [Microbacterium humi]
MSDTEDEFRFLVEEAEEFGISGPVPAARRDALPDGDGRDVSFIRYGTGGPAVTFLHGAALNAHTWDATAVALHEPALAIDLPGHGLSQWRDDVDYRPDTVAASVFDILERLGVGPHVLVGQSLGGLAAAMIAAKHPGAVRGLVVVDITPGVTATDAAMIESFLSGPSDFGSRDEIVDYARSFGIGVSRRSVARGVELNTRVRDDGRVVFRHHLGNLGEDRPQLGRDYSAIWSGLESLTIPVLLVRGSRGFLTDELVDEFLRRVPGSSSVTLEAGHNVQEDAPVALAEAIRGLISTAGSDQPRPEDGSRA